MPFKTLTFRSLSENMRILILHGKMKTGSYADTAFDLLIQFLSEKNFIIRQVSDVKQLQNTDFNSKKTVVILPVNKKPISIFFRWKLQNTLKKFGFGYLVQVIDVKLVSSRLPQLIITNADIKKYKLNKVLPQVSIATGSHSSQQKMIEQTAIPANQIKIISIAAEDTFQPITWSEQQSLKMQYTQGREYFLVNAAGQTLQSLTELLKAFSTFKKWQQSSMKLLVCGKLFFTESEDWKEKIRTYKFREDVVILYNLSAQKAIQLLAGAYAFIHVPESDNDLLPLLQAMKCNTPCISFATDELKEYADDAAIIIEPGNYDKLAEKMILLYKDEALRNQLIAKGKVQSHIYTKERTFASLAETLPLPLH